MFCNTVSEPVFFLKPWMYFFLNISYRTHRVKIKFRTLISVYSYFKCHIKSYIWFVYFLWVELCFYRHIRNNRHILNRLVWLSSSIDANKILNQKSRCNPRRKECLVDETFAAEEYHVQYSGIFTFRLFIWKYMKYKVNGRSMITKKWRQNIYIHIYSKIYILFKYEDFTKCVSSIIGLWKLHFLFRKQCLGIKCIFEWGSVK